MLIFANSASPSEISGLLATTSIDGITMNPSLLAASGSTNLPAIIDQLLKLVEGPVFAQVTSADTAGMLVEAEQISQVSKRVIVKVPCTVPGYVACRALAALGVPVNMTLCFNPTQALLAARAGARWISPFIGRLDDAGRNGAETLRAICAALRNYDFESSTLVLAASIRTDAHLAAAIDARVHGVTLSPSQILAIHDDPLTEQGCAAFTRDWLAAKAKTNIPVPPLTGDADALGTSSDPVSQTRI